MKNKRVIGVLTLSLALLAGCTTVQKKSAMGGAIGGGAGATIGHFATTAGGTVGGLVGVGLGATAGALAAEQYYGGDDSEKVQELSATVSELSRKLDLKDQQLRDKDMLFQKQEAQKRALLEAYDKAQQQRPPTLVAEAPANVQVTENPDRTITYTILSEVLFDSGKASLTSKGKQALHGAAIAIKERYPDADIQVRGHTDNVPIRYSPYDSNWDLSCARAIAVVEHLVKHEGISPKRLAATGCADTRPVASNASAQGRRKNRRAELVVRPTDLKVAELRQTH
ncbi:MAG: OmpA family protein [Planctomycetes bacterium]|nr:OmpA family protein [Planctomycetota bacterium]